MTAERFGLALENFTPARKEPDVGEILAYARRAEELGYGSLWAWDHMLLGTRSPFPFLESLTTLTAARDGDELACASAPASSSSRCATRSCWPRRPPRSIASPAAAWSSAWRPAGTSASSTPPACRTSAAAASSSTTSRRCSSSGAASSVSGEENGIEYRNALMLPRPAQQPRPTMLIGGYVDKVLRRVATKSDGWLTYFYTPESFATAWKKIRDFAEEAGRDPDELAERRAAAHLRRRRRGERRSGAAASTSTSTATCPSGANRAPTARSAARRSSAPSSSPSTSPSASSTSACARRATRSSRSSASPPRCCRCSPTCRWEPPDGQARRARRGRRLVADGDTVVAGGCLYSRAAVRGALRGAARGPPRTSRWPATSCATRPSCSWSAAPPPI